MSESEKYQGYAWIKVKKHAVDPQKTDRQNYDDLNEHHVAETTFLIEKVRELAQRLDAVRNPPDNLFADIPGSLPEELVQTLLAAPECRVERIVSQGHASPAGFWYDQTENEWVLLLQGAATLRFEDEAIELKRGDFVNIPAHRKHRVDWTTPDEPTIWLAIHYPANPP